MPPPDSSSSIVPAHAREFATTHWSVVLSAGADKGLEPGVALEKLCAAYWYPLYAFVRRQGRGVEDAQDLTQAFFAQFLEKKYLNRADRARGRFRTFLLACLKNFLANEWDRANAKKRGGGMSSISLDDSDAETRFQLEPVHALSADKIYERRWALTLVERVLERLRSDYRASGKESLFDHLTPALIGDKSKIRYADTATKTGMSEGAVKVASHRLRKRYRELFREEIAQTVEAEKDIDEELRHVVSILSA